MSEAATKTKSSDPRVAAAIAHWAPRFVSNGVLLANFVFVHDPKQMREAHMRSVECYKAALPLMRPLGERVAIPFEGKTLYGVLRKPEKMSERSPVLIMAPGLDSNKEELHAYEEQ